MHQPSNSHALSRPSPLCSRKRAHLVNACTWHIHAPSNVAYRRAQRRRAQDNAARSCVSQRSLSVDGCNRFRSGSLIRHPNRKNIIRFVYTTLTRQLKHTLRSLITLLCFKGPLSICTAACGRLQHYPAGNNLTCMRTCYRA